MSASYPSSVKSFTTKSAGQPIAAQTTNDLQDEVAAIEQDLISGLPATRGGTGLTAIGASGTVLGSNGTVASWVTPSAGLNAVQGRLTLTSGVPVTVSDVTAATTLYWALYNGNQIPLYTGTVWQNFSIAELSIAVPATTSQMYDVFVDYNGGTPALSLTAWTNDTTRATALTTQDGVYVLTGVKTKRYVGSFRTTAVSGQTEDSVLKRLVWNYYNRVETALRQLSAVASWTYGTNTLRQANASTANQIEVVVGVAEDRIAVDVHSWLTNSAGVAQARVGIGDNSTTANATGVLFWSNASVVGTGLSPVMARLATYPAAGYHFYAWLEADATGGGTTSWYGVVANLTQSGISASWRR